MRLGQVLAVRPFPLEEIRHGIEPEAVEAEIEPEAQDVEHRLLDLRVVVVQVGLMREEPVPVVLTGDGVPRPVRDLGVDEDDPCVRIARVGVRPHVPVALRRGRVGASFLEPGMVARGVVHHEVGDHADPAPVGGVEQARDVRDRPVVGMDGEEVGDVVSAVLERGGVHRQEPDAVDAEPLQVVELLRHPAQVAVPVVVRVGEAADVDLVEDGPLEPERVGLEPLGGIGWREVAGQRSEVCAIGRAGAAPSVEWAVTRDPGKPASCGVGSRLWLLLRSNESRRRTQTARLRSMAWTWASPTESSSSWSALPGAARRRRCAWWRGSKRSPAASCASASASSTTSRRATATSRWCSRATPSIRICPSTTTSPSA